MKKALLGSVAILALIATSAMAQNTNQNTSNSTSTSGAAAQSGSSSTSGASNQGNAQNITFNSPGNTTSKNEHYSSSYQGFGGGTANYNATYGDQTIRTAPPVYAPPVSGGNPCTLAVSGGASFLGWGAAAGGTFVDEDCANRQKIAMIHNAGYQGVAFELMCNDRATYVAAKTAGKPCAFRPQFEPQGATAPPVAPPPPTPVVTTPVTAPAPIKSATTLPRCSRTVTDNCYSG
jgi:hypothetical protein